MDDFGQRIAFLRQQRMMTIAELAVSAGMAWNTLIAIECNQHFPTLSELERLLAALGIEWTLLVRLRIEA